MGVQEPAGSEQTNEAGAGLHPRVIRAQNSLQCVEEPIGEGEIALHLGSGSRYWNGWVNVDLYAERVDVACDLRKLDFPDNYADRAVSVHVLEHFYLWEVQPLLEEWRRVLKPGGRLAVELPCMDKVFGHIAARMKKGEAPNPIFSWLPIWGDPSYGRPEMGHKWGYSLSDLKSLLEKAGFVDVQLTEARYHFPQRDMRAEAKKPLEK